MAVSRGQFRSRPVTPYQTVGWVWAREDRWISSRCKISQTRLCNPHVCLNGDEGSGPSLDHPTRVVPLRHGTECFATCTSSNSNGCNSNTYSVAVSNLPPSTRLSVNQYFTVWSCLPLYQHRVSGTGTPYVAGYLRAEGDLCQAWQPNPPCRVFIRRRRNRLFMSVAYMSTNMK